MKTLYADFLSNNYVQGILIFIIATIIGGIILSFMP